MAAEATERPQRKLYSVTHAGEQLDVTREFVRQLIVRGEITPVYIGRKRLTRIEDAELDRWIAAQRTASR